jgi:hypothetical protein
MAWTPPGSATVIGRISRVTSVLNQEANAMTTTMIAVDLAKNVFEVAVAHAGGGVPVRHRFT